MKLRFLLIAFLVSITMQAMATGPFSPATTFPDGLNLELSVYPNPSSGVIHLNITSETQQTLKVRIVNLIGQTVDTKEVQTNYETRFDLSSFPKGFYFVKVEVGKQEMISRIVIQ